MYDIAGTSIRPEHLSMVGGVRPISKHPGKFGFRVLFLGSHEQEIVFDSKDEAVKARAALMKQLVDAPL